jgi:hypothetical protein
MSRSNPRQDSGTSSDLDLRESFKPQIATDFSYLLKDHPEKVFRLVNDEKGRVDRMMRDGWEPVQGSGTEGSFLSRQNASKPSTNAKGALDYIYISVGQTQTTADCKALLMMIDETQAKLIRDYKNRLVQQSEQALLPDGMREKDSSLYAPNLPTGGSGLSRT